MPTIADSTRPAAPAAAPERHHLSLTALAAATAQAEIALALTADTAPQRRAHMHRAARLLRCVATDLEYLAP